jgi:RND family efflux transporter MFP subunit
VTTTQPTDDAHDHAHPPGDDTAHGHTHAPTDDPAHTHAAAGSRYPPREISPVIARTIGLTLHTVAPGPVEEVVELLGTTEPVPDHRHVVAPRTAGRVLHVHVQVGDRVGQGDVLVELDSPELAQNIYELRKLESDYQRLLVDVTRAGGRTRQLEFELRSAGVTADLAEAQLDRVRQAGDAVALNVLNDIETEALDARIKADQKAIELDVAREEQAAIQRQADALRLSQEAMLAVANVDPNQTAALAGVPPTELCPEVESGIALLQLVAPIDGVIVDRQAWPGAGVQAGEPLMILADYDQVQVHGELPESLLGRLTAGPGTDVRIRPQSDPDRVIHGRVRFVSPRIDPVKRTAHLIVDAPNPDGVLRDGSFASLAVVVRDAADEHDWKAVVPHTAVVREGPVAYVFVQDHPDELIFTRRDILAGARNDRYVEVLDGLRVGETIVNQGAYSLARMRSAGDEAADPHAGHSH